MKEGVGAIGVDIVGDGVGGGLLRLRGGGEVAAEGGAEAVAEKGRLLLLLGLLLLRLRAEEGRGSGRLAEQTSGRWCCWLGAEETSSGAKAGSCRGGGLPEAASSAEESSAGRWLALTESCSEK